MTGLILSLSLAGGPSVAAQPPHILPYPYYGPHYPAPRPPIYNPTPFQPNFPPPVSHYPPPGMPGGVMTIKQFVASFQPLPGAYSVVILHPRTGQPVPVNFHLPYSAEVPRVRSGSNWVKFDYRRGDDIKIDFRSNGRVEINYND